MALHLQTPSPRQGLAWMQQAFALFMRQPLALSSLLLVFMVAAFMLMVVPLLGGVLLLFSLPLLTLGYMIATRSAANGGPVHPGQLVEPLRGDAGARTRLIVLCGLYALATLAIIGLSEVVDGGRFDQLQLLLAKGQGAEAQKEVDALLNDPALQTGLVLRFGLAALLSVPFWHAPALVWWGGQGVAQALFSSTLALWRARGAFVVYSLAWVGLIVVFGAVIGIVFSLLGARQFVGIAAIPAGLMFTTAFYVSLYFTFADCFGESLAEGESPPA